MNKLGQKLQILEFNSEGSQIVQSIFTFP